MYAHDYIITYCIFVKMISSRVAFNILIMLTWDVKGHGYIMCMRPMLQYIFIHIGNYGIK